MFMAEKDDEDIVIYVRPKFTRARVFHNLGRRVITSVCAASCCDMRAICTVCCCCDMRSMRAVCCCDMSSIRAVSAVIYGIRSSARNKSFA